jgi:hypothetical protein
MKRFDSVQTEWLFTSAVMVMLTATLTAVIVAIPATIGVFLPFGNFSYGEAIALLQIGGSVLPVFVVAFLTAGVVSSSGDTSDDTPVLEAPGREP